MFSLTNQSSEIGCRDDSCRSAFASLSRSESLSSTSRTAAVPCDGRISSTSVTVSACTYRKKAAKHGAEQSRSYFEVQAQTPEEIRCNFWPLSHAWRKLNCGCTHRQASDDERKKRVYNLPQCLQATFECSLFNHRDASGSSTLRVLMTSFFDSVKPKATLTLSPSPRM